MTCSVLAIYLPQFHTISENNKWWGEGFTEWTNVKRGKPFYPGHYQPREPLNDDYYDLSDLRVLEKHTKIAQKAGISGFCFYHYYFRGKKLLEKPIEDYRDKSKEKFPYCLIWANQSWARTWYRADAGNRVLLQQTYGNTKDWEDHFNYLLEFFKDDRYLKIGNKPVYIIYLPQEINCRKQMFAVWQKLAKEQGYDGIYLIGMGTSFGRDNRENLYDAFFDLEPLSTFRTDKSWRKYVQEWKAKCIGKLKVDKCTILNKLWAQNAYNYTYLCKAIEKKAILGRHKTLFATFSGWDNTSRKDERGIIVGGSNPEQFYNHIKRMLKLSEKYKKEYLFLNAWNEWSESAYVEPDKKYGYQYLQALRRAISEYRQEK